MQEDSGSWFWFLFQHVDYVTFTQILSFHLKELWRWMLLRVSFSNYAWLRIHLTLTNTHRKSGSVSCSTFHLTTHLGSIQIKIITLHSGISYLKKKTIKISPTICLWMGKLEAYLRCKQCSGTNIAGND